MLESITIHKFYLTLVYKNIPQMQYLNRICRHAVHVKCLEQLLFNTGSLTLVAHSF